MRPEVDRGMIGDSDGVWQTCKYRRNPVHIDRSHFLSIRPHIWSLECFRRNRNPRPIILRSNTNMRISSWISFCTNRFLGLDSPLDEFLGTNPRTPSPYVEFLGLNKESTHTEYFVDLSFLKFERKTCPSKLYHLIYDSVPVLRSRI